MNNRKLPLNFSRLFADSFGLSTWDTNSLNLASRLI